MEHLPSHNKKIRGETRCLVCGEDPKSLESSINHFLELIGNDLTFSISNKRATEMCVVCEKRNLKGDLAKMAHMQVHFEEAHRNTTKCETCGITCPSL